MADQHPHANDPQWFDHPAALADLIQWLHDTDGGEMDRETIVYMLRKPWKYQTEWDAFMRNYHYWINA